MESNVTDTDIPITSTNLYMEASGDCMAKMGLAMELIGTNNLEYISVTIWARCTCPQRLCLWSDRWGCALDDLEGRYCVHVLSC